MMSTGLNMMLYGPPMMSPEHSSMPTMNTAEMFDNIWSSSDSGVSGDQSPTHPSSPTPDDDQILWDPGDTHVLEANLFNANINHGFEDDLDLFSFANELGSEEEIEQLSFPDNISEQSSSSSTITSHSIPSSPECFTDSENTPTTTDSASFIYPGSLASGNLSALCGNLNKRQRGVYSKKNKKIIQSSQRKQTSKESLDRVILSKCSTGLPSHSPSPESLEDFQKQNSDGLKGLFVLSPTKKKVCNILDSNVKWSDFSNSDQWCLADGLDTVISQTLGVREQLDLKAIIKPHNSSSSSQDVHENNLTLLDDAKLDAVRRYLKSLEGNSHPKSYHRAKNKMQKKPQNKYKNHLSEVGHPDNSLKSTTVNLKNKSNNKSPSKERKHKDSKSHYNQSENLKENLSENGLNIETPKFNKKTVAEKNKKQIAESKTSNKKVNMTKSQPSISWQQRKRPNKSQGTHTEEPQKQRNGPSKHSPSKLKEMQTGEPQKQFKKKMDTKHGTPTKKSVNCRNNKPVIREEFLLLKTRSRKEYRQLMKEKRSGLFLQEEVVSLSTSTCNIAGGGQLNLSESDTDNDVDILG